MLAVALASLLAGPILSLHGSPPVLRGTHFKPNETIRILVGAPSKSIKVHTGPNGTFTIDLGLTPASCGGFVVQAFGGKGSRASVGMLGAKDCSIRSFRDPTK